MVHPRKVYEMGDREMFDPKDPWVIQSDVLIHFKPVGKEPEEMVENPEQYAAKIAQGLKAPVISDEMNSPGSLPRVSEIDAMKAAQASPVDATKMAQIAAEEAGKATKQ
jgi:hypothetical protein